MKSLDMAHPAVYVNQPHPEKIDLESRFYEGLTANKLNLAWLHLLGVTGKTTILRGQKVFVIEKPGWQWGGRGGWNGDYKWPCRPALTLLCRIFSNPIYRAQPAVPWIQRHYPAEIGAPALIRGASAKKAEIMSPDRQGWCVNISSRV